MKILGSQYTLAAAIILLIFVIIGGFIHISTIHEKYAHVGDAYQKAGLVSDPNYQIFVNENYGYSFEYPKVWHIDDTDPNRIAVSVDGLGSKTIYIELPYPENILNGDDFLTWAKSQEWGFDGTPEEFFNPVTIPTGLTTYMRSDAEVIETVIVPVEDNVIYVRRVNGDGDGTIKGEDVYFHLLNSFNAI